MRFFITAANAAEPSLFEELWRDFLNVYVTNDVYYEHLGLEGKDMLQVKLLILGFFVGLAIACFAAIFDKRVLGGAVRTLLARGCLSPETAETLEQLGYARSTIVRHSVRKSVTLRRVVRCVEEEQFLAEQEKQRLAHEERRKHDRSIGRFRETAYVFDLEHDHFYIPEEMKYMADVKFERKGSSLLFPILFTVIMLIAYVVLLVYLPEILDILNDFAANFEPAARKDIV